MPGFYTPVSRFTYTGEGIGIVQRSGEGKI